MSRRTNTTALAKILDALHLQQKATLLALPYERPPARDQAALASPFYTPHLASQTATEEECNDLVRASLLECIELQHTAPRRGSARHETGDQPRRSTPLAPKAEIGSALEGRRLHRLDLSSSRITASFNRADLTDCFFVDAYFAKTSFNLATLNRGALSGGRFQSCVFHGTEAREVSAVGARFSNCVFVRADLREWDVRGATFYHCRFSLCDLTGWCFDGQTVLVEPEDWSRCRRLAWRPARTSTVRECRAFGHDGRSLSLPPREE